MDRILTTLIERMAGRALRGTGIISWSCPVPAFGNVNTATVATLGLNPSNLEFVDEEGKELCGAERRFHTLNSLRLNSWFEADARHVKMIVDSCFEYFCYNPYDRWFKKFDKLLSVINASFRTTNDRPLFPAEDLIKACHLDLIPYATRDKWTDLTTAQRNKLLESSRDTLAMLLRDSRIAVVICNGRTVVENLELVAGLRLSKEKKKEFALPRKNGDDVMGYSYKGRITRLANVDLGREVTLLGFNHNLQSSFGVTNNVIDRIREWIGQEFGEAYCETT